MQTKAQELLDLGHQVCSIKVYVLIKRIVFNFYFFSILIVKTILLMTIYNQHLEHPKSLLDHHDVLLVENT